MKLCFLNSLKYYHCGETDTDGSISKCRLHLPDPHRAFPVKPQETTEQHDTPQQPMTGYDQKRGSSTSPGQRCSLSELLQVQERYSQGTERLQHFAFRLPFRSLEAAEHDTLKLQWIHRQTEISKSGSTQKMLQPQELIRPQQER